MKKILITMLFCISMLFASSLNMEVYRDDQLWSTYHFDNVRTYNWMHDFKGNRFLRIEFYGNNFLDLTLDYCTVKFVK